MRTTDDSSLQLEAKLRTKLRAVEIGLRVIEIRNLEGRITALEEQSKRTYTDGELTVSNGIITGGAILVDTVVDDNLVEPITRAREWPCRETSYDSKASCRFDLRGGTIRSPSTCVRWVNRSKPIDLL